MNNQSANTQAVVTNLGGVPKPARGAKWKKLLLAVLIILFVGELGGGAFAYFSKMNSPEHILIESMQNLTKEQALTANIKYRRGSEANGITISGDMTFRGEKGNDQNGEAVLGIGSGDSRVTLTLRVIDGALYARADQLPHLVSFLSEFIGSQPTAAERTQFEQAVAPYSGQWYAISREELQKLAEQNGSTASLNNLPSQAELQKLEDSFKHHPFLAVDKTYPDETIGGQKCLHASLRLDRDNLVGFLTEVKNAKLKDFTVTDEDIKNAKKAPETVKNATVEIWAARKTKQLQQLRFAGTDKANANSFTLSLDHDTATIDKLQTPTNTKPLLQLLQGAMTAGLSSGSAVGEDLLQT